MQPPPLLTPLYEFKGIMSQVWQRWFHKLSEPRFVDRGDPAQFDFVITDLTTDGTWRDLDLSSIVSAGSTGVLLRALIKDDAVGSQLSFRKNGNTSVLNIGDIRTQVVDVIIDADIIVPLDAGRIIEYYASNTTWTGISIVVKGWWL